MWGLSAYRLGGWRTSTIEVRLIIDPGFLAELRPRAQRLSLGEAESKRVDLKVQK
jgi:hypothetical protein